jgi:hypothetical protein
LNRASPSVRAVPFLSQGDEISVRLEKCFEAKRDYINLTGKRTPRAKPYSIG